MAPLAARDRLGHTQSPPRPSIDSLSSVSTTSLVFDHIHDESERGRAVGDRRRPAARDAGKEEVDSEVAHDETGPFLDPISASRQQRRPMDRNLRRILLLIAAIFLGAWLAALGLFLASGSFNHAGQADHDPDADSRGSGKSITMEQLSNGFWAPKHHSLSWIADPDGRDGLLLEQGLSGQDYLVVEDVRADRHAVGAAAARDRSSQPAASRTLMKEGHFEYKGVKRQPDWLKPSPDLGKVLLGVDEEKTWRHSFTAAYYVLDVASGAVQPLYPPDEAARIQLATWSPQSDAVSFVLGNNLYVHHLSAKNGSVSRLTEDGGAERFYGVPDWVYEEEVFSGREATWWSADGAFIAFLRTNETGVQDFRLEYYLSRPTGQEPAEGDEAYPDVRKIRYPKAGSHNPLVDLQFFDFARHELFSVHVDAGFPPEDRLIIDLLWAGDKVLVKETNRVGDHLKIILVDVRTREARVAHDTDAAAVDGGWHEISRNMKYIPADEERGRAHDGFIDTLTHHGYQHLAYFTPLDNPHPVMLTSGDWEVVDAPSAVDLTGNLAYFVATKESSIQRHVYAVHLLDGSGPRALTDTSAEAYYDVSFSARAGFALLSYQGPKIPHQRVISTPSYGDYDRVIEDNAELADRAKKHELPLLKYGTLDLGRGVTVNYVERRPPHFDPRAKHPVLFQQYSGPGSQSVDKRFVVDFQAYVAAALGYLVVTVDPRGTGFRGRAHRVPVRDRLGTLESQDHIAAAALFAARPYVDPDRLAIWGWSYGGFATLKTLEQDAGRTFSYGMAVAPVTDWRFYDSIYTERYMRLPRDNAAGYDAARVANATALGLNRRFLLMHGSADDNVHFQNSLTLLDALDLAGVENYDVHVFPDSDHSITFHHANRIVYDKLQNWLINAFNGAWLSIANPKPMDS